MKLRIYTHKLKADLSDDFPKFRAYFKDRLDLDLDLSYEETKVEKIDAPTKLFAPNDGKYDIVMYIYDRYHNNGGGTSYSWSHSKTLKVITLSTSKADDAVGFSWQVMAHELTHCLFKILLDKYGIFIQDPLDISLNGNPPYFKNDKPYDTDSNHSEAIRRLLPYAYLLNGKKPVVTLTRLDDNGWQTIGKLEAGNFKCDTLEKPWAMNLPNVSCIPKGEYNCVYTFSPKFMKYTYEVQSVLNRTGIRIHSGNYFFDILGCILLGRGFKDINGDGKQDILNSRITIQDFEKSIGKKPFKLIIK